MSIPEQTNIDAKFKKAKLGLGKATINADNLGGSLEMVLEEMFQSIEKAETLYTQQNPEKAAREMANAESLIPRVEVQDAHWANPSHRQSFYEDGRQAIRDLTMDLRNS